jgi:murein L,D-transpeptidase YafK
MKKSFTITGTLALLAVILTTAQSFAALKVADRVIVLKEQRRLILLHQGEVLRSYRVSLGRHPKGRKSCSGDSRTPEGNYILDYRNPHSRYYRSIHISYPNSADIASARKTGLDPGGNIMIHGLPRGFEDLGDLQSLVDWTKGCIAVSNEEMDEIWSMVPDGTPIDIRP